MKKPYKYASRTGSWNLETFLPLRPPNGTLTSIYRDYFCIPYFYNTFPPQGSTLDGVSLSDSKHMLNDALSTLDQQQELSTRAALQLAECTLRLADITVMSDDGQLTEVSSYDCIVCSVSQLPFKKHFPGLLIIKTKLIIIKKTVKECLWNSSAPHLIVITKSKRSFTR